MFPSLKASNAFVFGKGPLFWRSVSSHICYLHGCSLLNLLLTGMVEAVPVMARLCTICVVSVTLIHSAPTTPVSDTQYGKRFHKNAQQEHGNLIIMSLGTGELIRQLKKDNSNRQTYIYTHITLALRQKLFKRRPYFL